MVGRGILEVSQLRNGGNVMKETFFYNQVGERKEYKKDVLTEALAAAGVHITGVTRGQWYDGKKYTDTYMVMFEFQWRSYGNYIWSKSMYCGANDMGKNMYEIYRMVKKMRNDLEDPENKGKYRYLEEE